MPESPIITNARIIERLKDHVFRVVLKNGKEIVAHSPKKLRELALTLEPGDYVRLEMTPFDFEKGRIEEKAEGF